MLGSLEIFRGIKAAFFDLDETLIDAPTGLKAAHRAVAKRLRKYLIERGIDLSEQTIRSKVRTLDDRMNLETRYDRDEWWPMLLKEIGASQPPRPLIKELTRVYWRVFVAASKPYPDAEPTLRYLKSKGYKLALVTDTDGVRGMKRRRAERPKFAELFDTIVIGGEDTARTKPSPEPLLLAASRLGMHPAQCIFVGDKPFTDIKAAKTAGMRTIWVKRRDWGIEERADVTVSSLAEIRDVL